jgi:peroxiredoxin Q/BCP
MPNIGDLAPDFTATTDTGEEFTLSSLRGRRVVLYFYPKDNTTGCTKEACDFRDSIASFADKNTVIIGVSPDSVKSHQNFKSKHELTFTLVADTDKQIVGKYGVFVEKINYGRKYMGVVRATFVIDEDGKVTQAHNKVKVNGHVEALLASL